MKRDRQTADEHDILALAADRFRERFEMSLAERLVLDQLNVPVRVLLAGRLIHHYLDAGILGALQDRLQRLAVVRHHADHIDLLRDEILDRAHLLSRIVGRRVDDRRIDAKVLTGFQHSLLDIVEPRDLHLANNADLGRIVCSQSARWGQRRCNGERRRALHESTT